MVKVRKAAELFRMEIKDFARFTGYSRQALYDILEVRNPSCNENRIMAAISRLKDKSDDLYLRDLAKARMEKRERETYLNKMCRHVHIDDIVENVE